jgi:chemotaxis protein CheX
MDVQFFKPFIDGTVNVLAVQCKMKATHGKPFIKGSQAQPPFEIAASIGLACSAFTGSITLCFPKDVYLLLMSNMLGENFTAITDELQDGAAELLNMIFGSAKVALNPKGYNIQMAIPSVIRGENLRTTHLTRKQVIVLPFITEKGELHIEISTEGSPL